MSGNNSIKIYTEAQLKNITEYLLSAKFLMKNRDEMQEELFDIFDFPSFVTETIKVPKEGITVFRAIKYFPEENHHLVSNFWHNSKGCLNRANVEGKPMFYGSPYDNTTCKEIGTSKDDLIVMGKWRIKKPAFTMVYLGFHEDLKGIAGHFGKKIRSHNQMMLKNVSEAEREMYLNRNKFFHKLFTSNNKDSHRITSLIADKALQIPVVDAIIFPSVARGVKDFNYAIRPEFVENPEYFDLLEIKQLKVNSSKKNSTEGSVVRRGQIGENGINWQIRSTTYTFDLDLIKVEFSDGRESKFINTESSYFCSFPLKMKFRDYINQYIIPHIPDNSLNDKTFWKNNVMAFKSSFPTNIPIHLEDDNQVAFMTSLQFNVHRRELFIEEKGLGKIQPKAA